MEEALIKIDQLISERSCRYIVTPNLDHIVTLERDGTFAEVYSNADLILADGKPLLWISRWLNCPIKEKLSGSDLFPKMCQLAAKQGYKVFLLGAEEGVAAKAAENLTTKHSGLENKDALYQKQLKLYRRFAERTNEIVAKEYLEAFRKFIEQDQKEKASVS